MSRTRLRQRTGDSIDRRSSAVSWNAARYSLDIACLPQTVLTQCDQSAAGVPLLITYEWDGNKASSNERKHGVGFVEASSVFDDPLSLSMPDYEHSVGEERWITMGTSTQGRVLVVVHVRTAVSNAEEVI